MAAASKTKTAGTAQRHSTIVSFDFEAIIAVFIESNIYVSDHKQTGDCIFGLVNLCPLRLLSDAGGGRTDCRGLLLLLLRPTNKEL